MNNLSQEKSTKIVYRALIISRAIIAVGVRWVFFRSDHTVISDTDTSVSSGSVDDTTNYYIDELVILAWNISKTTGSLEYTHDFISDNDDVFGLKSADVSLFDHDGPVNIKGKVVDILWELPIIAVDEIASTEDAPTEQVIKKFIDNGLEIDLGGTSGFEVKKWGGDILIVDSTGTQWDDNNVVLSVTPFACDADDNLRDCISLRKNLISTNADRITTSNGIKISNLSETKSWLMFNADMWYYVRPYDDKSLIAFTDLFSFSDPQAPTPLVDDEDTPKDEPEIDKDEPVVLTWDTDAPVQIEVDNVDKFWTWDMIDTWDLEEDEDTNKAKIIEEWEFAWWLSFPSTRWYTVYFSDKGVGYAWWYVGDTEALTIWDTSCTYGVKVTKRANIDNVNTNPDSIIYECDGTPDLANLPIWVTYIADRGDNAILKKDLTDALVGMEVGIQ